MVTLLAPGDHSQVHDNIMKGLTRQTQKKQRYEQFNAKIQEIGITALMPLVKAATNDAFNDIKV